MKLTNGIVFFKLFLAVLALDGETDDLVEEDSNHSAVHGIFRSILSNREFGSDTVKFTEWESPSGDLYVVPFTEDDESSTPALGLGYKFINSDLSTVQSSDLSNIVEIKEDNITAAGFPKLWKKHSEEETADDYFPFGSKKFMMIGLNKQSVDKQLVGDEDSIVHKESSVQEAGLFKWFDDEDDCNADKKTNKLFDTDHFLFVGVGSVDGNFDDNVDENVDDNMNNYDQDTKDAADYKTESFKIITSYTTTTVTSVHEVTITETDRPFSSTSSFVLPEKKVAKPETSVVRHSSETNVESLMDIETASTTHIPFVFSTTVDEHSIAMATESTYDAGHTKSHLISKALGSIDYISSADTDLYTFESISNSQIESHETTATLNTRTTIDAESWIIPTTWESYPFSISATPTTNLHYHNTTEINSSYQYFKTSSIGRNVTSKAKTKNGSIFTRINGTNSSTITSSQNFGNIQKSYFGSLFGLVFAFVSGVILI